MMLKSTLPLFIAPILQGINPDRDLIQKDNKTVFPMEYGIEFSVANPLFVRVSNTVFEVENIDNNNTISFENNINRRRLKEFEQKFSQWFISYVLEDDFEYGMESKAYTLVKEQMKINASVTKDWLNKIYVDNFAKSEILIGILRVIARFERNEIYPIGDTIATASLSHKDEIVQETAIRAFENWGGIKSIEILENVSVSSKWIQSYLKEVIADLKAEYVS